MFETLRTPPSKHSRRTRFAALEFCPLLDSSSINAKGWGEIARAIQRNYRLFDAFVILHGTDSLAYTSSALSFMVSNLGKPVILTGSQAPMSELQNDATDNLLGSLIIAGHYMIPEVCLFFNHKLFRGNRYLLPLYQDLPILVAKSITFLARPRPMLMISMPLPLRISPLLQGLGFLQVLIGP